MKLQAKKIVLIIIITLIAIVGFYFISGLLSPFNNNETAFLNSKFGILKIV